MSFIVVEKANFLSFIVVEKANVLSFIVVEKANILSFIVVEKANFLSFIVVVTKPTEFVLPYDFQSVIQREVHSFFNYCNKMYVKLLVL